MWKLTTRYWPGIALLLLLAACGSSSTTAGDQSSVDTSAMDLFDSTIDVADPDHTETLDGETDALQGEVDAPLADLHSEPTRYMYDPLAGKQLETFPDDYYTVGDTGSLTGLRVSFDPQLAPWIAEIPQNLRPAYDDAGRLDGFGTSAGIVMRFTGKLGSLPDGPLESVDSKALMLFELGSTPRRIPFQIKTLDKGQTLILLPMVPLKPKTRHGVVLSRSALDASGAAILPSATLSSLLDGSATDSRLVPLVPRYAELLKAAGLEPAKVSAAVVFTTQSIVETSVKIATDIKGRSFVWDAPPKCVDKSTYRQCDGTFQAGDYRLDGVIENDKPQSSYTVPVTIYLPPTTAKGPWPVVLFGHGITGDRFQAELLLNASTDLNGVLVSIDSVAHGDHPAGTAVDSLGIVARFFAIDFASKVFRPAKLRDNFRQSTYDKLQLLQLLKQNTDVDGDQQPDLKLDQLGYFGVSLGAVMGSELLALSDMFKVAVLSVGGGRVVSIISESDSFKLVTNLVTPPSWTPDDLRRAYPLAQAAVEKGDGVNYASHVLGERLPIGGSVKPHLLVIMALGDEVMPNVTTLMLTRALGVPALPPLLLEPGIVPTGSGLPLSGNLNNGSLTAGLFQYDRYSTTPGGTPKPAGHAAIHNGVEFLHQTNHFFETFLKGVPEIVDPFVELKTPPLP